MKPRDLPEISVSTRERFFKKLARNQETGCIEFIGYRMGPVMSGRGHGQFGIGRRVYLSHRVAYQIAFGKFDPALCVCHRCDNPPCCNPDHLFLGTNQDNVDDCTAKGRQARGERLSTIRRRQDQCNRKFTPDQIIEIRQIHRRGDPNFGGRALARKYGTSHMNIRLIVSGKTWAHIEGGRSCDSRS